MTGAESRAAIATVTGLLDQVWNRENHAAIATLIPVDTTVSDDRDGRTISGPLAFVQLINLYREFLPRLRFTVVAARKHGPDIQMRWRVSGRHSGRALGIMPTGRTVTLSGDLVARFRSRRVVKLQCDWRIDRLAALTGATVGQCRKRLTPGEHDTPIRACYASDGVPTLFFPVMTLPGWITWAPYAKALSRRRPVVTFQALGNRWAFEAQDPPPRYGVRMENRALRVALARHRITGPFDIVAHSAGGVLALDFALSAPEMVRSLTLIEPGLPWLLASTSTDPEIARFLRAQARSYEGRSTAAKLAGLFRRNALFGRGVDPRSSPRWPLYVAYKDHLKFRPAMIAHRERPSRLNSLRCPVLLIKGRESARYYHEVVRVLGTLLHDVEIQSMPGGHGPHYGPGRRGFSSRLTRFHRRVDQAPPGPPRRTA